MDYAREAALKVMYEINQKGAYANIALNKYLDDEKLRSIDRAFVTELVYGSIKWKLTIDRVIAGYSNIKIEKLSPWILNILRLGTYQILKMTKVPVSASCNESVKLARRYGHRASAGFVNAVLRNIAKNGADIAVPPKETDLTGYLSVTYSYPKWIVEKIVGVFGEEFGEGLLDAGNSTPHTTVRTNTLKISPEELIEKLEEEGVSAVPGNFVKEAVVLKSTASVGRLEAFKNGLFQVQDESSMLAAKALNPIAGDFVLDACSAPGGKATHMAQLMENKGKIIACDVHEHKLKLIDDSAERLGINIIESKLTDASKPNTDYEGAFDKVLLDAPCTGLGIIRRKPDIKWSRKAKDIEDIVSLQRRLIRNVSKWVKPGGVLVYSTCTVLPEENEDIINNFLMESEDFEADDIKKFMPAELATRAKGCMLQLYPNIDGTDGFFISRIRRKG